MYAVFVRHIFAFCCSLLFGFYLVPIIIRAALRIGFVDSPDGRLKNQKSPVPYLGGIAIFLPFITTLGLCYPFQNQMLWLLLGTTSLLFIGLIDDINILKPRQKFFGQFLAVLCFLKGGFSLKNDFFTSIPNIFLSGFWMLSVINAFNLIDVMDGLCTTVALCSACIFGTLAVLNNNYSVSVLVAAFIGSLLSFLWYNRPPARIYLGDAGSLFIGGFLASLPFVVSWDTSLFASNSIVHQRHFFAGFLKPLSEFFFIPCMILAIPLFEGLGLFFIRISLGLPFYNGSPHHFALYLQRKGWNKEKILLFVVLLSLIIGSLVFLFIKQYLSFGALLLIDLAIIILWTRIIY